MISSKHFDMVINAVFKANLFRLHWVNFQQNVHEFVITFQGTIRTEETVHFS